jgi:hypothetical protein
VNTHGYYWSSSTFPLVGWEDVPAYLYFDYSDVFFAANPRPCGHSVRCVAESYTIAATAGVDGTIFPMGRVMVAHGENKTFTFSAYSNYEIDQVLIDGTNNPAAVTSGSHTFTNVIENHTISVSFKEKVGVGTTRNYELQIYPNPTSGQLKIINGELKIESIQIFNVVGELVFTASESQLSSEMALNISHFPAGIYFVKIYTETGEVIKKVLKE